MFLFFGCLWQQSLKYSGEMPTCVKALKANACILQCTQRNSSTTWHFLDMSFISQKMEVRIFSTDWNSCFRFSLPVRDNIQISIHHLRRRRAWLNLHRRSHFSDAAGSDVDGPNLCAPEPHACFRLHDESSPDDDDDDDDDDWYNRMKKDSSDHVHSRLS